MKTLNLKYFGGQDFDLFHINMPEPTLFMPAYKRKYKTKTSKTNMPLPSNSSFQSIQCNLQVLSNTLTKLTTRNKHKILSARDSES